MFKTFMGLYRESMFVNSEIQLQQVCDTVIARGGDKDLEPEDLPNRYLISKQRICRTIPKVYFPFDSLTN